MAARQGITNAQLKAALKETAGIPFLAAEKLGTTRQNVWQRIQGSQELQDYVEEIEQSITDQAKAVTVSAMQDVDPATRKPTHEAKRTARWWLERRDKRFSNRTALTDAEGDLLAPQAINVVVQYVAGQGAPKEPVS